jgi:signal transduction histidine kinase
VRGEGLGLGLYIANAIVQSHGGTLVVSSTADEGTTFTFRLPRRVPQQHATSDEPPGF